MKMRRWTECWGGPILVLSIILISTLLATLVLRELRPCGWLDVALGDGAPPACRLRR
jgi:dolichol kinase